MNDIELGDLEFKPEDFQQSKWLANECNRLLRERLRKGQVVYAWKDQGAWRIPLDETDCDFTWKGRLVCIQECR